MFGALDGARGRDKLMGILIAILVTLAVFGSIMWIKPSRREVRISAMRRVALANGLRVRLLDEKLKNSLFPWLQDYRRYVLYEKHRAGERSDRKLQVLRLQDLDSLHELDRSRLSSDELDAQRFRESLPEDCQAIVIYPNGIGFLWQETGDEKTVSKLIEAMSRIEAGLLG